MTESQRFKNAAMPWPEATPEKKWYLVENDLPRWRLRQGCKVAISSLASDAGCIDGEMYLFKTPAGALFLGEFRRLASGYEAEQHDGPPMDSQHHGVTVVGEYLGWMK
jgi:hypothetical protein